MNIPTSTTVNANNGQLGQVESSTPKHFRCPFCLKTCPGTNKSRHFETKCPKLLPLIAGTTSNCINEEKDFSNNTSKATVDETISTRRSNESCTTNVDSSPTVNGNKRSLPVEANDQVLVNKKKPRSQFEGVQHQQARKCIKILEDTTESEEDSGEESNPNIRNQYEQESASSTSPAEESNNEDVDMIKEQHQLVEQSSQKKHMESDEELKWKKQYYNRLAASKSFDLPDFDPKIMPRVAWTEEENAFLLSAVKKYGFAWSTIASIGKSKGFLQPAHQTGKKCQSHWLKIAHILGE